MTERNITLERPGRKVQSYSRATHLPSPYGSVDDAGLPVWRCLDCGVKLRRYFYATRSEWRLRHDWRRAS